MGETSRLTKATSKSDSLRTTVPAGIVKQFNMKEKDTLDWNIEARGLKLAIVVKHIKEEKMVKRKEKLLEKG
jgi:hypothetical protein